MNLEIWKQSQIKLRFEVTSWNGLLSSVNACGSCYDAEPLTDAVRIPLFSLKEHQVHQKEESSKCGATNVRFKRPSVDPANNATRCIRTSSNHS